VRLLRQAFIRVGIDALKRLRDDEQAAPKLLSSIAALLQDHGEQLDAGSRSRSIRLARSRSGAWEYYINGRMP
jgi:hypothetical protein